MARPSLAHIVLAAIVVPLVVGVGSAGLVGWWSARRTAEAMSVRVQAEVGRRVAAELRPLLDAPHAANAANAALFRLAGVPDDDRLRRHLFDQLRAAPTVSYVQLGRAAAGGFLGVERTAGGFRVEVTTADHAGKEVRALDDRGDPVGDRLGFVDGYDARARPWYRAAIAAGEPVWSPIYQYASRGSPRIGITAVEPVTDPTGAVIGVAGADLELAHLSALLRTPSLGPGASVVIVERDGALVASSTTDLPFVVDPDGTARRVNAADVADPLVQAAAAAIGPRLAGLASPVTVHLDAPDVYVYAAPLADDRGLDWVLLINVPTAVVAAGIDRDARLTAAFGLLLVAGAIGIGGSVGARVTRPLLAVAAAADELARGRWDAPLPDPTHREVDALIRGFHTMRTRLAAAFADAEQARDAALEGSRAKSTFLARMSHELRTPLNAVVGYTELLLDEFDPATARGDLHRIRSAAGHLLRLIDELLDLARIEAGRIELVPEPVDLAGLAADVADTIRPLAAAKDTALEVRVAPDAGTLDVDRTRLRQVLINLLGNAAKFTDAGTIALGIERTGRAVTFRVRDSGIGMCADELAPIFEPFRRLPSARGREGAGLGLAIVHRLVTAMGGAIDVESAPGRGTTFTVTLPG
ncbi:MAG: sensor histidine kinase [Myxococcota bacterium]